MYKKSTQYTYLNIVPKFNNILPLKMKYKYSIKIFKKIHFGYYIRTKYKHITNVWDFSITYFIDDDDDDRNNYWKF